MQSIRSVYKTYQTQLYDKKPILPSLTNVVKSSKLVQQQIRKMQQNNNYQHLDQCDFYKDKFKALQQLTSKYQKKKINKQIYIDQVRSLLHKDYNGISVIQSQIVDMKKTKQPYLQTNPPYNNNQSGYKKDKSPLKQFFDQQQAKNLNKKITFNNLLTRQQTPLKYGLRAVNRSRSPTIPRDNNINDSQIQRLKQQNDRLRNRLDNQRSLHDNQDRYRQLQSQISQLNEQNKRLKIQVSSRSGSKYDYVPQQEYDPYNIKVRQNNIRRINSRNYSQSQKLSQYGEQYSKYKGNYVYYDNQSELARSDFTHNPVKYSTRKLNVQHHSLSQNDLLNSSHSTIQTQYLNLDQSQLQDQQKNHVCRQKIAFFKKSMVLYKSPQFDIAFKKSDLNYQMDKLRVILYINNKTSNRLQCKIQYDYQRQDFDIDIKRHMEKVQPRGQARQQLEIYLRNANDLGSLITAKVLIGSTMKKIIIPALFIDFDPKYRIQYENNGYIQRNISNPLTIKPMGQFSSYDNTANIIQITKQYEQTKYPMAKLYGKSKITKGIVKLTWKQDKLKIQTCQQWKTLIGYLFLNAQQTIMY